jgi:pyridoxal phosphate enzyme (YggS family)
MPGTVEAVRQRIAGACERADRDPKSVRLIAISKGHTTAEIRRVADLGVTNFGENRLQEAIPKLEDGDDLVWHFVGHVQSNKAARIAQLFDYVHSVDSEKAAQRMLGVNTLIEVDFTGIEGRAGVKAPEVRRLIEVLAASGSAPLGLMTVAPQDVAAARQSFMELRNLRDELRVETQLELPELSMGMSDDFELAIEEGATMVRIGRALFGERSY